MNFKELLEQLKVYLETQKRIKNEEKAKKLQESALTNAIENLNANAILNLVDQGVDVKAFDKNCPLYIKAMDAFEIQLFNIFTKSRSMKYNEYLKKVQTSELEELSPELQEIFAQNKAKLLQVLEILYQLGINPAIAANENYSKSILSYYISNIDFLKDYDIFAFFISKPEVIAYLNTDYNAGLTSSLIRSQSKVSTIVLKELIDRGLKPISNDNLAKYARSMAPNEPDLINPMLECLAFAGETKKDKINLIYPMLSPELQEKYKTSYEELNNQQKQI